MTTLIAATVILAVACLRGSEAGVLAVLGIREPKPATSAIESPGKKEEQAIPRVDWATQLSPRGAETRIGDNLKYIIDKERGGPVAAVVLFTDGGNNAGSDYKLAATAAADALIPVYTVGLGSDKRPANLRVVDLEAPERVYPGDKFSVTGYVQAQNYNRGNVTVELFAGAADGSNETKEDEQTLDVGRSGHVVTVTFELKPAEQGVRRYRLLVRPFEGEIDRRDNEKTAKVEIIDRRTRVLLIAGGPTRDFLFLRNQLYRDKEVISDVWLQSGKPGISQEANEILYKFPETEDQLFEYDCIVAFDPDWEQLDDLHVKLLERWVAEKAGGLAVIAGPVFTPQWSGRRRGDPRTDMLKALYPVVFYSQSSATLSLGRFGSEKAWPLQFSRDGLEAEFLWLDENAAASEKAWQQFEGVCGYYAVKEVKPGARIYARFGDPDTAIDNLQPIYMAGQFYGSGRVFFMASGEMWRVRAVDDVYFEQFYTKLMRWISEGRLLRDSSRGVLLVDKDRCALGDQIAVRAILEDAQHRPLSAEQVQAVLVQPDSTRAPLTLKKAKDEGRGGVFVEQFTALQEGDYQIQLQHPAAADQVLVREVRVKIPAKETEFPERNDALLRDIADKTGGDYYVGVAAAAGGNGTTRASLANIIKPQDQSTILPGTPDRAFERQLMGWLLGLICGVLCMEWLLRRLSKLA
jgi:von Willebrand factor type A domain